MASLIPAGLVMARSFKKKNANRNTVNTGSAKRTSFIFNGVNLGPISYRRQNRERNGWEFGMESGVCLFVPFGKIKSFNQIGFELILCTNIE